jgi:hypothetical protein
MFRFFKKATGVGQGEAQAASSPQPAEEPAIQVLSFDGRTLRFHYPVAVPPDTRVHSKITLPFLGEVDLAVVVRGAEEHSEPVVYYGEPEAPHHLLGALQEHYPPPPDARPQYEEKRALPRLPVSFQVRSRLLPNFQATTYDLTRQGLRLIADGPLEPGTRLDMVFNLDDQEFDPLQVRGEVIWTLPRDSKTHWIGLRILEDGISEADAAELARYIERKETLARGVLTRDYQL